MLAALVFASLLVGEPTDADQPAPPSAEEGEEPQSDPEAEPEAEADSEEEPEAEAEAEPEPEAEPETELQPPSEPDAEPSAEPARLRGRVLAFGDRDPVVGARIIAPGHEAVDTGKTGDFNLDLPPGSYEIVVRAPGFDDLETTVVLLPNQDLEVEFRLEQSLEGKQFRTVVKQERAVTLSSKTLRNEEAREVPGTGGDPLGVITSMPGVMQVAGFLPYVVVRGAAPGNTGYYLDGTRVPILFHVAIGPSVIHPAFIDSVDFYPSGAPVRLGRYASGIIEARTRPARRDRVHGEVDLRLTDAGTMLEVPIDRRVKHGCKKKRRFCEKEDARGSLTVAGRYSYTAAILSLVQSEARIRYWDYQARFDHDAGKHANYTAFAYGSFDDIGSKEPDPETGEEQTFLRFQFHRFDNRIRHRLPRKGTAVYAVVLGLDQTGFADGDSGDVRTNEWRVAPRIDLRTPINDVVALDFGLDQEFQIFRLDRELIDLSSGSVEDLGLLFSDRFVSATGAYFDVDVTKGRFDVRPGVRVDVYSQVGSSPYLPNARAVTSAIGVDPRIVFREHVGKRWTLGQSLGMYHQPPSFPIPVPGIESFGFERGLQRNIQGGFSYEVEIVEGALQLSQSVYLGRLTNLQDYELGEASDEQPVEELEDVISQVAGWATGVESMVRLAPTLRVFGWAAYTLAYATREFPDGGTGPSNWDQRHIFNVVLGYKISHKWSFGGRVHYHTGRPWTAPEDGQTQLQALSQSRNNARLPPFFQLDLRIARTWRWPNWQLMAYLDLVNATYSREVFQCSAQNSVVDDVPFRNALLAAKVDPARGIAKCTPQGFRYVVPTLGLNARF